MHFRLTLCIFLLLTKKWSTNISGDIEKNHQNIEEKMLFSITWMCNRQQLQGESTYIRPQEGDADLESGWLTTFMLYLVTTHFVKLLEF